MTVIEETSSITAKGQTTVPKLVRQALGVGYGGKIAFRVEDGVVTVHAIHEADPALGPFLRLLEQDIATHHTRLAPLPEALLARVEAATTDVAVAIDEAIDGDVAL